MEKSGAVVVEDASVAHSIDAPGVQDLSELGAIIEKRECQLSLWQNAKLHRRALLICSVSFTAGMLYGYDSVVNGASLAMPSFQIAFGERIGTKLYLPAIWTSLWSSMSSLAQALGAVSVGFLVDRFGRKWPACGVSLLTLVGTGVQYAAQDRVVLLVGKMINGFGIGSALAIAQTYASEVAPTKLRGPVQQGLVFFFVFMLGVGLGIVRIFVPDVSEKSFRTVFAIQWIVGAIAAVAFAWAPESPSFLVAQNKMPQAHRVMKILYGDKDVEARLAYLQKTIQEEQALAKLNSTSYVECFRGNNLKRTLTVIFLYTSPQWAGAALLTQSIVFLIQAGLVAIHAFDVSIGGFGLSMLVIASFWVIGNRVSRRTIFFVGCVTNMVFMTAIGAMYYAKGQSALLGIAVLMNVLIAFQSSLMQACGYSIGAELSSLSLRAKTLSIGILSSTFTNWLTGFTVPYMYNLDAGNLGARTAFVFAAFSFLLVIGAWFLVPETTGMTAEMIDHAYDQKIPARKINVSVVQSMADEPRA